MKFTLTRLLTFTLFWTLSVLALPPSTTLSSPFPTAASILLGINCRGTLSKLKASIATIPDNALYSNGIQIACSKCAPSGEQAICAFPQNLQKNKIVTGAVVKQMLGALAGHGCSKCGSCPVHAGNDVRSGEVTVNYTARGCGDGVCPYAV